MRDCKLQIANCKLQIEDPLTPADLPLGKGGCEDSVSTPRPRRPSRLAICNLPFGSCVAHSLPRTNPKPAAASALFLLLAFAPAPDEGYTFPPVWRGDMAARLNVLVLEEDALPRVRYQVTVDGSPTLQIEPAELADAVSAWKASRSAMRSEWTDGRVTAKEEILLEQTKLGLQPLPDVKVRFRAGPTAKWEQAEWKDILKDVREPPLLAAPSKPSAPAPESSNEVAWVGGALALLAVIALVVWRSRRKVPPPPDVWALGELDRLEKAVAEPACDAAWFYTVLSNVVRRYLVERFQMPALQRTTAEFLAGVCEAPPLVEHRVVLRHFFEHCDLGKFAGATAGPADWREAVIVARTFIRQTTPEKPK